MEVGDKLKRFLGGKVEMPMVIVEIRDTTIVCDAVTEDGSIFHGGWEFDKATGQEIDEDLGWGPRYGKTGSYVQLIE